MIEVRNISKTFRSIRGNIHALDDISFTVEDGKFISIIGPSGSGKSTLIKIIGDIIEPSGGTVHVDGLTSREARLKGAFSFAFQNPVLLPWRRIIDNVRLPLEILHQTSRDASHMLSLVGLEGFENKYPRELSGGMQQRVALARALTFDPKVLLMDEPFGAVDELTRATLNAELMRIWSEIRVIVLFITHSISESIFLSDRVLLLSARPARLKYVLNVEFPRPRREELKETDAFQEQVRNLRERLE